MSVLRYKPLGHKHAHKASMLGKGGASVLLTGTLLVSRDHACVKSSLIVTLPNHAFIAEANVHCLLAIYSVSDVASKLYSMRSAKLCEGFMMCDSVCSCLYVGLPMGFAFVKLCCATFRTSI